MLNVLHRALSWLRDPFRTKDVIQKHNDIMQAMGEARQRTASIDASQLYIKRFPITSTIRQPTRVGHQPIRGNVYVTDKQSTLRLH